LTGWNCLDAFAGTGALGLEAASRGAAQCILVEQDAALVRGLQAICTRLAASQVRVQRGDGIAALQGVEAGALDLVFLDPPFDAPVFERALKAASTAIKSNGLVYLEAPKAWAEEALAPLGLMAVRTGKAGMVHYHLLRRLPAA